jgi:hypothetical protein
VHKCHSLEFPSPQDRTHEQTNNSSNELTSTKAPDLSQGVTQQQATPLSYVVLYVPHKI